MAPLRRLCLLLLPLLFLALLLLPPPAAPAPAPVRRPDWAACRILSRELSRLLATVKEPPSALVPEGSQRHRGMHLPFPPVPGDTREGPEPPISPSPLPPQRCLHRIRQALQHYRDLLGSDIFREQPQPQLETTMEQLLRHVQEGHGRPPRHPLPPTQVWEQQLQRHLALKRLRSFAALMSRVFNHSAR
ncbi:IL23A protein, partial [Pycnonotus jocosus]|nr:IL23A protein [Pycnonotus jocosus]